MVRMVRYQIATVCKGLQYIVVQVASRKNLPQGHSQNPTIGHVMRYDEW